MAKADIPKPPTECSCGKPTTVLLAKIQRNDNGKVYAGPFSTYALYNDRESLHPNYRFITWIPLCADCFYEHQPKPPPTQGELS